MSSNMPLGTKVGRVMAALFNLVKSQKPPKANMALAENLNDLLYRTADDELTRLISEVRENLRAGITAQVAKVAPAAVPEIADDLSVLLFVVRGDDELVSRLNKKAVEHSYGEVIRTLKAHLIVAKRGLSQ